MADQDRSDADTARKPPRALTPRRAFLHATLATAAATGLGIGCGDDASREGSGGGDDGTSTGNGAGSTSGVGSTTDSASSGSPSSTSGGTGGANPSTSSGGAPGSGGAGGGPTPTCEETEADIEGPYYTAGAPFVEAALPGLKAVGGVLLRLSGRVYSAATCEPVADAVLDIWQADDDGAYDGEGFTLRGKVRTDAEGRYEIDTCIPGHYLNGAQYRPAHIHVKVSAEGHELLTTQLYFPDDPYNDIDPWFDERLLIAISPGKGLDFGAFDFTIASAS